MWPSHNIWNLKNISLRIKSQKPTDGPPPTPFKYSDELEDLEEPFDFTLQKHKGKEKLTLRVRLESMIFGNLDLILHSSTI